MASGTNARISSQVTRPGIISRIRCHSFGFFTPAGCSAAGSDRSAEESRPVGSLTLVNGCHPVLERREATSHGVEIRLADLLGDGADAPISYSSVIHRRNRRNLRTSAAEKDLVGDVQLAAVYLTLLDRDPQVSRDPDDACSGA